MLYDQQIASWLGGEKMSRQSQHHADLQDLRADKACNFLLADPKFNSWYRSRDSKQLVIIGEMGSGKSVAMAFLVDELRQRSEHQLPQAKICYYYCRKDGNGQAIHIYSVLIMSPLEQLAGLKKPFFEWHKRTMASGTDPAANFKTLEQWLQDTLEPLDRQIIFAIDTLDECDRQSRDRLLKSLGRISETTPRLKILLSSSPEEDIIEHFLGTSMVAMRSDATRDRLIVEKKVRLLHFHADVKALAIERLSHLAQGSAIWAKMAVELIEARAIKALEPMRAFLNKLPQPK
ncbi:hypothetical protein B0T14DRAFT_210357 [Immersiella caudata]|uniref:Nephrocystin 3-like N-terminal domain-containing protein n=1 Tax=Immersiella caudata TaxID=314043 RepID=A0AA39WQ80_9PEZI|nr:hypothetical protein B0T14DRAFT_210357 [Immersiella caudata]